MFLNIIRDILLKVKKEFKLLRFKLTIWGKYSMNKKIKLSLIVIIIIFICIILIISNLILFKTNNGNNIPFDDTLNKSPDEIANSLAITVGTTITNYSSAKRSHLDFDRFDDKDYIENIYNCSNNGTIYVWFTEDNNLINVYYNSKVGYLSHTENISLTEQELKEKAFEILQKFGIDIDSYCIFNINLNNDKTSGTMKIIQTYNDKQITNYNRCISFIRLDYDKEYNLIRDIEINNWYKFPDKIKLQISEAEAYEISAKYLKKEKENPYWDEKKIEYYSIINHRLCYKIDLYHIEEGYITIGDIYSIHVDVQNGKILKYDHLKID